MKVEFNHKSENPFFGMSNSLRMFQNGAKGMQTDLDAAWNEANTPAKKELFWSLLFSFGDVANRQHVEFEGTVDNGGFAQREYFREILPWMWAKVRQENLDTKRFLELVVQYTTLDNLLAARVRTKKKTTKVEKVINMIEVFGVDQIVPVLVKMFNGTPFEQYRVARFLVGYTFTRRERMLPETKITMTSRKNLLKAFVETSGLGSVEAYKIWKRNFMMEANLFSTGVIKDMDRETFLDLVQKMPGNARFRLRNKLFNEKWATQAKWFKEWETYKEQKQAEVRELTEQVRQGVKVDRVTLHAAKKEAKVNSGAKSFEEAFNAIMAGKFDKVSIQGMLDKVRLDYGTLVITDVSSSMRGGDPWPPLTFAAFMATICLLKNPDAEASDVFGMFSSDTKFVTGTTMGRVAPNSLLRGHKEQLSGPLIDRTANFETNFRRIYSIMAAQDGYTTNFKSISTGIKNWVKSDPTAVDTLANYPIWTIITDGRFNNSPTHLQSLLMMQKKMEGVIGFKPFLLVIDVARSSADIRSFEGASDFMYIPPQPGVIEQILTNFRDLDVRDVYTPLQGIYRSNRYFPVRKWVNPWNYGDQLR